MSTDCKTNFWKDQAYSVGTADSISVTRSTQLILTPASGLFIPSPNQANDAVNNCNKVAQALEDDYCYVRLNRMLLLLNPDRPTFTAFRRA
jgi:hypothetical protein